MITIHPDVTAADLRGADPAELARRLLAHINDNNRDCRRKGRGARPTGESNPAARLTEADVREMRRLSAQGTNAAEIGRRFGISRSHAHAIVHGQRWSNR